MTFTEIVVASENTGKARELAAIFGALFPNVRILRPSELGRKITYPEEGADYTRNAVAKARAAAMQTGLPAIADDSGIEVDHLSGAPGPLSARWGTTDDERNDRLLAAMAETIDPAHRRARYRAVAALALPNGETFTAEGTWEGRIVTERRGSNGFGYDPIFLDEKLQKTGGEMSAEEKSVRSHRGKALKTLASKVLSS